MHLASPDEFGVPASGVGQQGQWGWDRCGRWSRWRDMRGASMPKDEAERRHLRMCSFRVTAGLERVLRTLCETWTLRELLAH